MGLNENLKLTYSERHSAVYCEVLCTDNKAPLNPYENHRYINVIIIIMIIIYIQG